jgi:Amiloride-sensitive sodium channel
MLLIVFESDHFFASIKFRLFSLSHLFASVGGFMSLIAGVTVITLFEFLYFFVIKNFTRKTSKVLIVSPINGAETSRNVLIEFIKSYSESSTVHGLSHFGQGKVFWFVE